MKKLTFKKCSKGLWKTEPSISVYNGKEKIGEIFYFELETEPTFEIDYSHGLFSPRLFSIKELKDLLIFFPQIIKQMQIFKTEVNRDS